MVRKRFSIIKLIKNLSKSLERFPKYLTKFSKKTFSISQIITLRTLKEVLNKSYDSLVDFLEDFPIIGKLINMDRVPHPTTIMKYSKRIGIKRINNLIKKDSKTKKVSV